jgi:peptidoglycan hydrolase CwlO-like protein
MNVAQTVFMIYVGLLGPVAAWLILRRIDRLEARVDALPTREEYNALGARLTRVEQELISLRSEIAALRSDLTQIALAVGARLRPQTG